MTRFCALASLFPDRVRRRRTRRPKQGRMMASKNGSFRFRVSDAVQVPLRGMLLRLRLNEGAPSVKDLAVGRTLRLRPQRRESAQLHNDVSSASPNR